MPRIFISDSTAGGTHGATVKAAILANNANLIDADITLQLNASYDLSNVLADMATAFNAGYEAFVHCTTLAPQLAEQSDTFWQSAQTMRVITPLGNNAHEVVTYSPDERSPQITCGASDGANNETGYGNALWFFDDDNGQPGDASSQSTGVIAGKLLYIKDQRGCDWNEAIYAAQQTASENGTPTLNNGYGKIDVAAAIAWSGTVPWDPFLPLGTVGTLSGSNVGSIATLNVTAVTNATEYYLEKNTGTGWNLVDVKTSVSAFTVVLEENIATQFRYRASNGGGETEYSNTVTILYSNNMSTIRTTVINAIKAALLEIDGTAGYATDFGGRVTIGRVKPWKTNELPAINLKYANNSPEVTDYFSTDGPSQKWNKILPIEITIMMPDAATYAEVDDASADVFRKLGEDDKYGISNVEMTTPESETIADESHEDFLYRGTTINVNIMYRTTQWQI